MKQVLLISLALLVTMRVVGQMQNVDSLVNVLETKKLSANEKFSIYNDICHYYTNNDTQKAMLYAQEALSFAEKEKNNKWILGFYTYIGDIHQHEGDYDEAFECYNKALGYAMEGKEDASTAYVYGSIAILYNSQGKTVTALDYFLKALSLYEKGETVKHKSQQIVMLTNIGTLHLGLENLDLAIQFFEKAEKLAKELDYSEGIMQIYYNFGRIYLQKKEYVKALNYALKSLELSHSFNNKRYECGNLGLLALINKTGFKDLVKAEGYANEYLAVAKQMNFPQLLKGAWHTLATVYFEQKRYTESEAADLTALKIDSISPDLAFYINYNLGMANMYLGNKEKATYYLEKSMDINKELTNKTSQNMFLDLETKYETEKKEARIASLEKERRLYSWLGVAGGLLLVSLGLALWQTVRNARKERQLVAAEAVQDGELNERARLAEDLHDRLGGSLSAVKIGLANAESLQNVNDKLDECIKEVREITHNLMPRSLRLSGLKGALEDFAAQFPNVRFHFFGEEKRFRERMEFALYCCANELVTNSIRHSGAENINVQLVQSEKYISLTVQDDGCGFDEKTVENGIGLKNIRDRIASYNGKLDISSSPGVGTETVVELRVES